MKCSTLGRKRAICEKNKEMKANKNISAIHKDVLNE